ncbi:cholecystokinin receptor type A-like isoform X2 [Biomphalaria glabrata]|uniref:Gastrin/cholecystokinin type B receptor n=1 Tax=Biomphalaria glabrata TaxID=6526 RepID=A0A9W3B2B1_BIOGL|nr:cholecystokinin receptor type A-like isoform X2 [Biomphalaria glabrata]
MVQQQYFVPDYSNRTFHNIVQSSPLLDHCEQMYNDTGALNSSRESFLKECMSRMQGSRVSYFIIIPYLVIFLLSVVGNVLVILTLVRHKKMRTITNMYLLNLAFSDLLLALFCMPFTLIPMLMQKFIFGSVVCFALRYVQAISVGVSCATLVAISMERFYAICQPLRSRKWQTLKHSYRVIMAIWLSAISLMIPIAVFNKIIKLKNGDEACREIWPNHLLESMYTVLLDVVLLVIPLFLMGFSYARIAKELWSDVSISSGEPSSPLSESDTQRYEGKEKQNGFTTPIHQSPLIPNRHIARSVSSESYNSKNQVQVLSPAYNCRVLANKKRVVKMLFVVVLEYFLCWTPLYLCNSWATLDYNSARNTISPLTKTVILSLSYLSSCIHPITYCFMNRRFRQSFVDAFNCCSRGRQKGNAFYSEASQHNGSIAQVNKSTMSKHSKVTWKRHR